MKDIKIRFKGVFAPSGKNTGIEYMVGKARLEKWQKEGKFEIEVLDKPKPKTEKKAKKEKKS